MITKTPPVASIDETQRDLGERVRQLRIRTGLTQRELASRANTGIRAVRNLENGSGTTVETLVRALRALGADGDLRAIAPLPSVSPMAQLRNIKQPRRASTPRRPTKQG